MTTHHVVFDLDVLKEALDASIANADRLETDAVVIGRATWVMARSLCDEYEKLADAQRPPDDSDIEEGSEFESWRR